MINTVVIQGNVCADLELQNTANGTPYCRFTVAINERDKTNFIPVTAWRTTAEFVCKYFRKGQQIGIEGKISQHSYTDNNGGKHSVVEVIANSAHFCGNKAENGGNNSHGSGAAAQQTTAAPAVSDLGEYEEILSDGEVPF